MEQGGAKPNPALAKVKVSVVKKLSVKVLILLNVSAVLTFVGTAFAYNINPDLASNKAFMFCMIIGLLWLFTFFNMLESKWATSFRVPAQPSVC